MGEPDKNRKLPSRVKGAEIDAFLKRVAATPAPRPDGGRGRLIFAMDATASRAPSWDTACQIQGEMFKETAALGGLEVQLVFYRGFGECRSSNWVTDSGFVPSAALAPRDCWHYGSCRQLPGAWRRS